MVPRIWNQTNPLFDQWAPCWWLSSSTQLRPVSDLLSLSLFPPQKLKQLSRGYLEVVKTLFDRHSPPSKVNRLRSLHGPEHKQRTEGTQRGITLISFYFCVEGIYVWLANPEEIWLTNTGFSVMETTSSLWWVNKESLRGFRVRHHGLTFILHNGHFGFYSRASPM